MRRRRSCPSRSSQQVAVTREKIDGKEKECVCERLSKGAGGNECVGVVSYRSRFKSVST